MIYPKVRISELEADTAKKKIVFDAKKEQLMELAQEELHPVTLVMNNKKTVVAGILSLIAAGGVFGKIAKMVNPKLKNGMVFSLVKAAWFWKLLSLAYNFYKLTAPKPKRTKN